MNTRLMIVDKYELAALSGDELREALELDIDFAYAFDPEKLRDVAFERYSTGEMLAELLAAAVDSADSVTLYTRPGFLRPLTDREWLIKMSAIALASTRATKIVDEDETEYPAYFAQQVAQKQRRAEAIARRKELEAKQSMQTQAEAVAAINTEIAPAVVEESHVTCEAGFDVEKDEPPDEAEEHLTEQPDGGEREVYLPAIRDGYMHLPNLIVGSGIVKTGAKGKARQRWNEQAPKVISRVSGYKEGEITISYSGEELRPGDIETWSKLLFAAGYQPLGTDVHLSARALLTSLPGRGTGGNAYATLREEVIRLQAAMLHIRATDRDVIAQMADLFPDDPSVVKAKKTGFVEIRVQLLGASSTDGSTWSVEVPRKIRTLFGKKLSSWFDETMYYTLKGDTARRLYLLYGAHVNCWPLRLPELREYLGSTMAADNKFRDAMDAAHEELKSKGAIKDWKFEQSHRRLDTLCYVVQRRVKKKLVVRTVARRTVAV